MFHKKLIKFSITVSIFCVVSACLSTHSGSTQELTSESEIAVTQSVTPIATSTPAPLGGSGNPIIMAVVQSPENSNAMLVFDSVVGEISQKSGYDIIAEYYADYPSLLADMENGLIHFAWLSPASYVYAHNRGFANVIFVTNHYGVDLYGVQFLANRNSGFNSYYDDTHGHNTSDVKNALGQFEGKQPCWVSKTSLSGFAIPFGLLNQSQINVATPAFLKDSTGVIRALYVEGICDFGATYSIIGDPRTASAILTDLPDALNQIPVIWKSDAIIPTLNMSVLPDVPTNINEAVTTAFQEYLQQDASRSQLTAGLDYDIQDLKLVNHDFYAPFQEVLDNSEIDLLSLLSE